MYNSVGVTLYRTIFDKLAKTGCDLTQGYFYNKPLLAKVFEDKYL
ncbi:hypothetical protein [uncultured Clostridium sp.]|nr:hypothetical protein [uncultured Clostridium sp.]